MRKHKTDVCITGIGVVSAFGNTLTDFTEGINRLHHSFIRQSDPRIFKNNVVPVSPVKGIDATDPEKSLLSMGKSAIRDALHTRGVDSLPDAQRMCLIAGSGMGFTDAYFNDPSKYDNPEYLSSLAQTLAQSTGLHCDAVYIGNACAAGSQAISYGMDLVQAGIYDLVIAGGVDILSRAACAGFLRLHAIDPDGCRPFDANRRGIAVGEGAVFYTLERRESCGGHRSIYASLPAAGITCDAHHIVQMAPDGAEAVRAMEQAISRAGADKTEVDCIVAHGTGTIQNDRLETQMIRTCFGAHAEHIYVTAPKGALGHTGGASGAFGLLTAISAFTAGKIPPIANLEKPDPVCSLRLVTRQSVPYTAKLAMVNAFAFGGTNAVLLCRNERDDLTNANYNN